MKSWVIFHSIHSICGIFLPLCFFARLPWLRGWCRIIFSIRNYGLCLLQVITVDMYFSHFTYIDRHGSPVVAFENFYNFRVCCGHPLIKVWNNFWFTKCLLHHKKHLYTCTHMWWVRRMTCSLNFPHNGVYFVVIENCASRSPFLKRINRMNTSRLTWKFSTANLFGHSLVTWQRRCITFTQASTPREIIQRVLFRSNNLWRDLLVSLCYRFESKFLVALLLPWSLRLPEEKEILLQIQQT